jgi:hypothetical protein
MGDPELVARAQLAAERLERAWDRWRRLHGLAAEQAQPVSSYVGYSLAEPWGRPRVVFGVGAEEAEQLSALLEQDSGGDPRFSQGLLWEPASPEAGEPVANGARYPVDPANGTQFAAAPVPPNSGSGARQGEQEAETDPAAEWAKNMPTFQPAPTAGGPGLPGRDALAGRDVPEGIRADLAGWTSGELPGQASAGLAAWPPPDTAQADGAEHAPAGPEPTRPEPTRPEPTRREPARPEPTGREAGACGPRGPEAGSGTPDPAAWLRLALLGP